MLIPGKDALSALNLEVQSGCSVSIASSGIISAMATDEIPTEMRRLIELVAEFTAS